MRITDERDSDKIAAALSKTSEWHPTRVGPGLCRDVLVNDGTSWAAAASRPRVTRPLLERGRCHHCGVRVICILSGRASAICRVYTGRWEPRQQTTPPAARKLWLCISYFFFPLICHETMQSTNPREPASFQSLYCALLETISCSISLSLYWAFLVLFYFFMFVLCIAWKFVLCIIIAWNDRPISWIEERSQT